jgi:hypothetical protein
MAIIIYLLITKLFPVFIGLWFFKHLPFPYRIVLVLVVVAALTESVGFYISHYLRKHNVWLFDYYMVCEVWLMGTAAIFLITNKKARKLFVFLMILNTIFWFVIVNIQSIYVFASSAFICGLAILTFMYIVVLFQNSLFKRGNIIAQPVFWLCFSTILCCGCDIPVMGLYNFLTEKADETSRHLTNINFVLDLIRYPLIGISFFLMGRMKPMELKPSVSNAV